MMRRLLPWGCGVLLALLLAGCGDAPWNNPYPAGDSLQNILYSSFSERPKHLDPAISYSSNEVIFTGQIYEPPLQYHYLKRPYSLEPLTATALPQPVYQDAAGRVLPGDADAAQVAYSVYEIRIHPGIRYQPHPALAQGPDGKPLYHALRPQDLSRVFTLQDFPQTGSRELVAQDYVHQIKRLAHPRLHSPIYGVMAEYIVGLRALREQLERAEHERAQGDAAAPQLDLERFELPGARVVDRYTYRITLLGKYPQFIYWLAMPFFAPVPPEADHFFSQPGMAEKNLTLDWYPVGTGPFLLAENNPNRRMVLVRNPNFHGETYPAAGEPTDAEQGLLQDAGRPLPFIDKVVFSLEKENIPYWNKFLQGYYDASGITSDSFDQAVRFGGHGEVTLTPELQAQGVRLQTGVQSSSFYLGFNMLDPAVGGYGEQARKLRQAVSIVIDYEEYISIFANGRGIAAQGPIPPGIFGYREEREGLNPYVYEWVNGQPQRKAITEAQRLLAEAGYPAGREAGTGKPLLLYLDVSASGPDDKARLDWFRKQFAKLNVQLIVRNTDYNRFQEKMHSGNAQLFMWGWNADYPDPENFLFLLYGPNGKKLKGGENAANYDNAEFNRLFERMKNMDNGPARQALIDEMVQIARRDAPWAWGMHPKQFTLYHAWYHNTKPNLMANNTLKYLRVDPQLRDRQRRAWNRPVVWPLWLVLAIVVCGVLPAVYVYRRGERRPAI